MLGLLNLTVNDVAARLRNENVNVSAGRIEEGSQRFLVRTINQFANLDQMRDMLLKVENGVPIRLKDVSDVRQDYKEREGIVRINGHEAIELAVYKEGDGNTVAVAKAVNQKLEQLKKSLPPGASLTTIDDQSVFIQHSLDDVRNDALIGGTLAVLMIFFFLGHARMIDHLQQQIAQFLLEIDPIASRDGVGYFIGFFDRIGRYRPKILLDVPRATLVAVPQRRHDFDQARYVFRWLHENPCARSGASRLAGRGLVENRLCFFIGCLAWPLWRS